MQGGFGENHFPGLFPNPSGHDPLLLQVQHLGLISQGLSDPLPCTALTLPPQGQLECGLDLAETFIVRDLVGDVVQIQGRVGRENAAALASQGLSLLPQAVAQGGFATTHQSCGDHLTQRVGTDRRTRQGQADGEHKARG